MEIFIKRTSDDGTQTLGELSVKDYNGVTLFSCKTLELPDKGNKPRVSCIPKGVYMVEKGLSPSMGKCFKILNVPNRKFILIHSGNFYTQILGCCLVGSAHIDINKDGKKDVINSKPTLAKLLEILPQKTVLTII